MQRSRKLNVRCSTGFALLLSLFGVFPSISQSAEVTQVSPMLRGDVDILFDGGLRFVPIEDQSSRSAAWEEVGRSLEQRYGLEIRGRFSPFHGLGIELQMPIVFHQAWTWTEAREFGFDPASQQATMAGGRLLGPDELNLTPSAIERAGLGDIGFGLRFLPFAQRDVPGREAPASLAFDLAFRFPTGGHRDAVREDGKAGPGVGGFGIEGGVSASRALGIAEPFLSIHLEYNLPYEALPEEQSSTEALVLDPADEIHFRFGAEIAAAKDEETGRTVVMGLSAGVRYRSPHEVLVGTRLPLPMVETQGLSATSGEHILLDGKVALRLRPRTEFEVVLDFGGQWTSPHHLERITDSTYTVRNTNDGFALLWSAGTRLRFR